MYVRKNINNNVKTENKTNYKSLHRIIGGIDNRCK